MPHLNQTFPAITNFGIKPTLQENQAPLYETHIPGFNQDIYGKKLVIECIDFLREEKKFDSLEELKKQIAADIAALD